MTLSNNEGETATRTVGLGLFAIELFFLFVTMVDLKFVARCNAFLGMLVLPDINELYHVRLGCMAFIALMLWCNKCHTSLAPVI